MVLCHIPPFCSLNQNISEGYLILKIIYSVTKYLIKHPVVYFLSSESTLNNSSDIYVIKHIITKTIGLLLDMEYQEIIKKLITEISLINRDANLNTLWK